MSMERLTANGIQNPYEPESRAETSLKKPQTLPRGG